MKKIIALITAGVIAASLLAGCGNDPLTAGTAAPAATDESGAAATEQTEKKINRESYDKSLEGLAEYFNDLGYISNEKDKTAKMEAKLIGAKKGNRYSYNTARVELYVFDTKNPNETADTVIDSVERDGSFTLYDKKIEAFLSDNRKYLMIYTDSAIGDDTSSDAYKTKQAAIKALKDFE